MAKDSQRLEQEFIATAREKTGHDLAEWMNIVQSAGLAPKMNTILNWLKSDHKLNHMQAQFIAGIYLNDGKPVFDYEVLFANLVAGKDDLIPAYRALESGVQSRLSDAEFIPTKAYISIEGKRCFACATLTKKNIRVGLDLGDEPFGDYVQKAKSLGAMPNLTHMVEITTPTDVNPRLLDYVERAYKRAHKL